VSDTIETPAAQTIEETVSCQPHRLKCRWLLAGAISDHSGLVAQWTEIDCDSERYVL
jgi:hypothetical protein